MDVADVVDVLFIVVVLVYLVVLGGVGVVVIDGNDVLFRWRAGFEGARKNSCELEVKGNGLTENKR